MVKKKLPPTGVPALHWMIALGEFDQASVVTAEIKTEIKAVTGVVMAGASHYDQDRVSSFSTGATAPELGNAFVLEKKATPLHVASYVGDAGATAWLLAAGASASAKTTGGATPLHYAARRGDRGMCADLLAAKRVKVDAVLTSQTAPNFFDAGVTPLMCAAESGDLDTVALLLDHGADATATTREGCTTLLFAARGDQLSVAELLLDHGADAKAPVSHHNHPTLVALHHFNAKLVERLLQAGADPHGGTEGKGSPSGRPLANPLWRDAMMTRQVTVLEMLRERGVEPRDNDTMRWALNFNDIEDVIQRLAASEPWHGDDFNGLVICASKGFVDLASVLIEHGADPNQKAGPRNTKFENFTPLHAVADPHGSAEKLWRYSSRSYRDRCLEMATTLIAAGADPNATDKFGNGPLWTATYNEFDEMVELLLAAGADPPAVT